MLSYTFPRMTGGASGSKGLARAREVGQGAEPHRLRLLLGFMLLGYWMGGSSVDGAEPLPREVSAAAKPSGEHAEVVAAGFGFQVADSSLLTVRTYEARKGTILSEDSFDVNGKEEGAAITDGNRGRIFAGGIGTDSKGNRMFLLRVYDAETGRFLWEGQLNLLKPGDGGAMGADVVLRPTTPSAASVADRSQNTLQTLYSVRALNPVSGNLLWQDRFAPGNGKPVRWDQSSLGSASPSLVDASPAPVFELVVQAYDTMSGALLWQDSFDQLEGIGDPPTVTEQEAHPHAIPLWNGFGQPRRDAYFVRWR